MINYLPNGKIYIKIEVSRMKREKQSNERKKKNSDSGSEIMQNLNNTQYFKIVPEQ